MSWLVQPRLINGPFDDPGVFIDFRFGRRALLFDLGDISWLSSREILRVSHVFVSHAHMDHFSGFDRLLRLCLHRPQPLHLFGPAGFIDRVAGKLDAYSWNLLDGNSPPFAITASEFNGERVVRRSAFHARDAFRQRSASIPDTRPGLLLDEEEFQIEAIVLDHGVPCLAFALQERRRVNVWTSGLDELGLPVGPWLNQAKSDVRRGEPDDFLVAVPGGRTVPIGMLKENAFRIGPGQRIAYVTDAAGHTENMSKILKLAAGVDELFIEATFLEADRALADANKHLTATDAGTIARRAGVSRTTPFHFSARYLDREHDIRDEVDHAFRDPGPVPAAPSP